MILGIHHLTLSDVSIDSAKQNVETLGFKCSFVEQNVFNHPSKKHLLAHYQPHHDIAMFKPIKAGIAIEIVNHGNLTETEASYVYHNNFIELKTANIEQEMKFWKSALRFNEQTHNILYFRSPVPHWSCTMKFCEQANLRPTTLDSSGYTCLAFLTNNIASDIEFIKMQGAFDITNLFQITVNKRKIDVTLFRTPTGTICELIQIRS